MLLVTLVDCMVILTWLEKSANAILDSWGMRRRGVDGERESVHPDLCFTQSHTYKSETFIV